MRNINGVKMYTSQEVKELLGIGGKAYRDLRKKGLLRTITLGGFLLTSEEAIKDYLTGKTLPTPDEPSKTEGVEE